MRIELTVVTILLLLPLISGLFERQDVTLNIAAGSQRNVKSISYRKRSSTRVTLLGQIGERLSLTCRIRFSRLRGYGCSDDYFYIGYDRNSKIKGAQYYCGRRTISVNSLPTTGAPVIVIGKYIYKF